MSQFMITETSIPGLLTIRPRPIADERGWFMRSFSAAEYAVAGIDQATLVQENHSRSRRGVLRGLHTRAELREAKLIRAARGSFILDDAAHLQLRIPAGCAHGFQALSDFADVCYKVDAAYDPALDVTIAWDDPELAIEWPLREPALSDRDRLAPPLSAVREHLGEWFGTSKVGTSHAC